MTAKNCRMLVVGSGNYTFYEVALTKAFQQLGYDAEPFYFRDLYYHLRNEKKKNKNILLDKLSRFEGKYVCSIYYNRIINCRLIDRVREFRPTHVFFYNTRCFNEKAILCIKKMGIKVIAFSNDDPFSIQYPKYFWRKFLRLAQLSDLVYSYRQINVNEYRSIGCERVKVLKPYYMKKRNYPLTEAEKMLSVPDVVYIGHLEDDGRVEWINYLIDNGIHIGVRADTRDAFHSADNLVGLNDTFTKYNSILGSAKIALVFLSEKNRDTYTRRCFEIPATKTLMLSAYTEDLAEMFTPDKEAVYFTSKDELLDKVRYYLSHDTERKRIANNGYRRLMVDGHDILDRAEEIMQDIHKDLM